MRTKVSFAVFLLVSMSGPALSYDSTGKMRMYGAGGYTCGRYLSSFRAQDADFLNFTPWTSGYISAANANTPNSYDVLDGGDIDSVMEFARDWCSKNPFEKYRSAVANAINARTGKWF